MRQLVLGLIILIGVHSVRIFADGWRTAVVARIGEARWKGLYGVVSLLGFALVVWGFGQARETLVVLWETAAWARNIALFLILLSFILMTAAYVPGTRIKAVLGHPMIAGVSVWAFAHLIASATLAGAVLFGSFLAWSACDFMSLRRRDRIAGKQYPAGMLAKDALAGVIGFALWAAFGLWAHAWITGIRPI